MEKNRRESDQQITELRKEMVDGQEALRNEIKAGEGRVKEFFIEAFKNHEKVDMAHAERTEEILGNLNKALFGASGTNGLQGHVRDLNSMREEFKDVKETTYENENQIIGLKSSIKAWLLIGGSATFVGGVIVAIAKLVK